MTLVWRVTMVVLGLTLLGLAVAIGWNEGGLFNVVFGLSVAGITTLILLAPPDRTRALAHRLLWVWPFTTSYLVHYGVLIFSNERGNVRFFELVSQIIPILVLALLLELRLLSPVISSVSGQLSLAVLTIAIFSLGEAQALAVVISGRASENAFAAATSALVTGVVALIVGALAQLE